MKLSLEINLRRRRWDQNCALGIRPFFGVAASHQLAVHCSKSSLSRHRSDTERNQGTFHSCRCARPASQLHIPGTSENWLRSYIEARASHPGFAVEPFRRTGMRAAGCHSAGHARSDTRCGRPARSRPRDAHRIHRNHGRLAPPLVRPQSHRRGLSVARSRKTKAGHSRQGLSGCGGPGSLQHT